MNNEWIGQNNLRLGHSDIFTCHSLIRVISGSCENVTGEVQKLVERENAIFSSSIIPRNIRWYSTDNNNCFKLRA